MEVRKKCRETDSGLLAKAEPHQDFFLLRRNGEEVQLGHWPLLQVISKSDAQRMIQGGFSKHLHCGGLNATQSHFILPSPAE